jgi:hypothetical protein
VSRRLAAWCGGFLLAVLWFDLMFDTQVLGLPPGPLPEPVLASIAGYYARVTTGASPMGRLVGVVMALAVILSAVQLARASMPRPLAAVALLACGAPVLLAALRVFPNAVRLAQRADPLEVQSALARSICTDHLICLAGIVLYGLLQIAVPRRPDAG